MQKTHIKSELVGGKIISFEVNRDINKFREVKRDNTRDIVACLMVLGLFLAFILTI